MPALSFVLPTPTAETWSLLPPGCIHHSQITPLLLKVLARPSTGLTMAFKAQRLAAQARGASFMPYGVALRRLRIAVAHAAANGGQCSQSLMLSVFGDAEN